MAECVKCVVSVIIVNYNTRDLLLDCIQSILRETEAIEVEILVVDNASSDSSVEAVRTQYPQCHVMANCKNLGFGTANNRAIRRANGKYTLILNPDTELLEGSLRRLIAYLDAHPSVAVVGPRLLYSDGSHQPSAFKFPNMLTEFLVATFLYAVFRRLPPLARLFGLDWAPDETRVSDYLCGCCLLCRTGVLHKLDGFDEGYFLYSEEVDLQYRIRQQGWKVVFCADASIIHHHRKAMEQDPESNFVELYKSQSRFLQAHHSRFYVFLIKALWISHHILRIAVFAPISATTRKKKYGVKVGMHRAALSYLLFGISRGEMENRR